MTSFPITNLNRVRRLPERGQYDAATVYEILDAALVGHVGFIVEGRPFVIPTLIARSGDELLLHGATSSRLLRHLEQGNEACVAVTHLDGLVLARSVFHHSVNYRSAVVFGRGRLLEGNTQRLAALETFTEKLLPGRWADARRPNDVELKATAVIAIRIESASAKIRTGAPKDDEEDYALPVWAGILPLMTHYSEPQPDGPLPEHISLPDYLREFTTEPSS
jgi:nitroimidazol reductase NimA-like FMN-containing flavoprotein (pyridoxamine 5'-phosphate oxidase superfamily)